MLLAALVLAACGGGAQTEDTDTGAEPDTGAEADAPEEASVFAAVY
jgi:hypothetical protein